jgi:hypothetical protein
MYIHTYIHKYSTHCSCPYSESGIPRPGAEGLPIGSHSEAGHPTLMSGQPIHRLATVSSSGSRSRVGGSEDVPSQALGVFVAREQEAARPGEGHGGHRGRRGASIVGRAEARHFPARPQIEKSMIFMQVWLVLCMYVYVYIHTCI